MKPLAVEFHLCCCCCCCPALGYALTTSIAAPFSPRDVGLAQAEEGVDESEGGVGGEGRLTCRAMYRAIRL